MVLSFEKGHLCTDFVFIESKLVCVMKPKNVFLADKYIDICNRKYVNVSLRFDTKFMSFAVNPSIVVIYSEQVKKLLQTSLKAE